MCLAFNGIIFALITTLVAHFDHVNDVEELVCVFFNVLSLQYQCLQYMYGWYLCKSVQNNNILTLYIYMI